MDGLDWTGQDRTGEGGLSCCIASQTHKQTVKERIGRKKKAICKRGPIGDIGGQKEKKAMGHTGGRINHEMIRVRNNNRKDRGRNRVLVSLCVSLCLVLPF